MEEDLEGKGDDCEAGIPKEDGATNIAVNAPNACQDVKPLINMNPKKGRSSTLRVPAGQMGLKLEIPPPALEPQNAEMVKISLSPTPTSTKGAKLFSRGLLSRASFKSKTSGGLLTPNSLKSTMLPPPPQQGDSKASGGSGPLSWARALMPLSVRRTTSLPGTPLGDHFVDMSGSLRGVPSTDVESGSMSVKMRISRSLSVPVPKTGSLRRSGSSGGFMLVRSATPRPHIVDENGNPKESKGVNNVEDGEEIPVEEAVCRICLDVLNEEGETLKMECYCKGELALAHEACAMKWFGIKGNRTCDVCGHEVQNLPVTLIRLPNANADAQQQIVQTLSAQSNRMWQDIPILVMISMLAYFCFLEQLLVRDMRSGALAIALPFACVLGLLSSITASSVVSTRYVWLYAAFQFGIVILFSHLFYSVIKVEPVLAVLLAALAGFGLAMSSNAIVSEYLKWRSMREHQRGGRSGRHVDPPPQPSQEDSIRQQNHAQMIPINV